MFKALRSENVLSHIIRIKANQANHKRMRFFEKVQRGGYTAVKVNDPMCQDNVGWLYRSFLSFYTVLPFPACPLIL